MESTESFTESSNSYAHVIELNKSSKRKIPKKDNLISRAAETKKKKITLTNGQWRELCERKKNELSISNRVLTSLYGISESTCSEILSKSDFWLAIDPSSKEATAKWGRKPGFPEIEVAVAFWTEYIIENRQTLTRYLIQEQAKTFANMLNESKFVTSNGWLQGFKQCHGIQEYKWHGEAQSAPIEDLPIYRQQLKYVINEYSIDDIFNCNETSLYY